MHTLQTKYFYKTVKNNIFKKFNKIYNLYLF